MKKQILMTVSENLHRVIKKEVRDGPPGYQCISMSLMAEIGVLLFLTERGLVTSAKDAADMGASVKAQIYLDRIFEGKPV